MNTILIDDEVLNLKNLELFLSQNFTEINIIGSFTTVDDAYHFSKNESVDLVFLDINMPEKDGFHFLEYEYNSSGLFSKKEYLANIGGSYPSNTIQTFEYDSQLRLIKEVVKRSGNIITDYYEVHRLEYFYTADSKVEKVKITFPAPVNSGSTEISSFVYFEYNGLNVTKIDAREYNDTIYEYSIDPNKIITRNFLPDLYRFDFGMDLLNIFRYPVYKNSNVVTNIKIIRGGGHAPVNKASSLEYITNTINQNLLKKINVEVEPYNNLLLPYLEFTYDR